MVAQSMHRRRCLQALVGTTFVAPTLRFFTRTAEAAAFPLRFLFVYTSSGRYKTSRSSGTGATFTLGPDMAPLEKMKNKLVILDGVDLIPHTGEEHPSGRCAILSGRSANERGRTWTAKGLSMDRYLAGKIGNGVSFYTGITSSFLDDTGISWNAAGAPNDNLLVGSEAFVKRLFPTGGAAPPTPSPTLSPKNRSEVLVYDHLMAEVGRLKKYAPKSEVEKLELHLQTLQQIRAGLAGTDPAQSTAALRTCGATVDLASASGNMDRLSLAIAHAFACGRARVGVVQIGEDNPYHELSHEHDMPQSVTKLRQIDAQWAGDFANLLRHLDSFAEDDGTLLDNTIVVWGTECSGIFGGDGMENGVHGTTNMPFVIAGGRNAGVKNGQRVVTSGHTNVDLLRTLAGQLGVDARDFGDPAFARGPIAELLS